MFEVNNVHCPIASLTLGFTKVSYHAPVFTESKRFYTVIEVSLEGSFMEMIDLSNNLITNISFSTFSVSNFKFM